MKKSRRNKRKRENNKSNRLKRDLAQRSELSNPQDSEAGRAQTISGSLGGATRIHRVLDWRTLFVLLIIAVGLHGLHFMSLPLDASDQQDALVPINKGPTWNEIDDPTKDGWDTEALASQVKQQLELLGKFLAHPGDMEADNVENLITADFACGPLQPDSLVTTLDDHHFQVERAPIVPQPRRPSVHRPEDAVWQYRGAGGLINAIQTASGWLSDATDVRFEVKVFQVVPAEHEVSTRQYFTISGRTKSGIVEQHATWNIDWAVGGGGSAPRMRSLLVEEFEQTESHQPSGPLFADCTESVLSGNRSYAEQFLRGMNHWHERIQDPSTHVLRGSPGLAVGDVNGDGLDDLYVCQEFGLPNCLFIQNEDGTARDESVSAGVNWLESSRSALLVDLDNDSDQDLVVAIQGGVVVAENDGRGRFSMRDVLETTEDAMSLSAVDFDRDGRLDIYVCGYFQDEREASDDSISLSGNVLHDANNGGSNSLFRNEISDRQSWHFAEVTEEVGLNENNHRYSLAASWDDFDNDGDLDLYVANDYGRDHFYRNDSVASSLARSEQRTPGRFVDISNSAHVEDSGAGMSVTWGDYDRDGWVDAMVSNMWSSAGKRITSQRNFQEGASHEMKQRYQRFARGNTLLRNQADGTFDDRSAQAGIEMGRWAWGSHFVDLNNDGWEDLVVANGFLTTNDSGDL
ncbi:MAG: FG-GAP repeat domain-containing protein [Bythopirellula sp.]